MNESGPEGRASGRAATSPEKTTSTRDTAPMPATRDRRLTGAWWVLPALTFVVGAVLGAVVVWVASFGDDGNTPAAAAPSSTTSTSASTPSAAGSAGASPASPGEVTVTVPAACSSLAQDARQAADVLTQAGVAARDLDSSRLADIARQMQDVRDRLSSQSAACTAAGVATSTASSTG
jgi:hypothetical protein